MATTFADLHDTPGRMKAKGVIKEIVPWKNARKYFYYRLKRRLEEEYLKRQMQELNPQLQTENLTDNFERMVPKESKERCQ